MKVREEIFRLAQKPPEEPVFCLRAQDALAAGVVREWAERAERAGTPASKIAEARALADEMDSWPVKMIPGCPETKRTMTTRSPGT